MEKESSSIMKFVQSYPLLIAVVTDVSADLCTQKFFQKKKLSFRRLLKMGSFALLRTLILQQYFPWLDSVFPGKSWDSVCYKLLIDQVFAPLLYFNSYSYFSFFVSASPFDFVTVHSWTVFAGVVLHLLLSL